MAEIKTEPNGRRYYLAACTECGRRFKIAEGDVTKGGVNPDNVACVSCPKS